MVNSKSLFNTGDTPSLVTVNDPNSVELGVKFQASTTGAITGIRFYKDPQNTGTHVADLWSAAGTLLASATFTNETASGWQQVNLSTPVIVTAGTTYVVSYHTDGNYSADPNYFATAHTNGDLTALASGTSGGDGLYAYGAGQIFPTDTYNASNYWVDVVFDGTATPPPVATNDSAFATTENTPVIIPAALLLANDTSANGFQLSVTGVSNSTNGTVSYFPDSQSITFVPASDYSGTASFAYSISDGHGGTASATVGLLVTDPSTESLFSPTATPSAVTVNDPNSIELGVRFQASINGEITGLRFYKGPQNVGSHVADLWSATGALLASATFTNETATGWQQVNLANPVPIMAGTIYVASYHTDGNYSVDPNYFATAVTNGDLTALATGSGGDGVYAYGAGQIFPTDTFNASNYWVDVVFNRASLQSPVANDDSGFVVTENDAVSIPASTLLANDTDPNGLPLSITAVGNLSSGTVSYDPNTQTISFVPTTGYIGSAGFTYTISDGQSGTASANVSLTVTALPPVANNDSGFVAIQDTELSIPVSALFANDTDPNGLQLSIADISDSTNGTASYDPNTQSVIFTPTTGYAGTASFKYSITDANGGNASATASLLVDDNDPSTISLFDPTTAPSIVTVNDLSSVELGVRFQASTDGEIIGLRFYKGPDNDGTHTADLWNATTGELVASTPFTDETPEGWQQVNFSTPVQITGGETYVASYHTSGNYSADPNLFATAVTNTITSDSESISLTAPSSAASGGNGVYAYGSGSLMPTNSFNATSYGVDVIFKGQLVT